MAGVVKGLDQAMESMNLEKVLVGVMFKLDFYGYGPV
jgi:hypothetical protein